MKRKGSIEGEMADKAEGAANIAANNEAVAVVAEEPKTRGRKPSDRLTFAKFKASIDSGNIPDGVRYIPQEVEGARVVKWDGYEAIDPVLNLDEHGNLTLTRLFTDRTSRSRKPTFEVLKTVTAAEVLAFVNSTPASE